MTSTKRQLSDVEPSHKKCQRCSRTLPIKLFGIDGIRRNNVCHDCVNNDAKIRRERITKQFGELLAKDPLYLHTHTKVCPCCRIMKPLTMYSLDMGQQDFVHSNCKVCRNRKVREATYNSPIRRAESMLKAIYRSAKERGVECNLTLNDISSLEIPIQCPVLKTKMIYDAGVRMPQGPSIDRINPNLGYVIGNIRIISERANQLKSNASHAEIANLYKDSLNIQRRLKVKV